VLVAPPSPVAAAATHESAVPWPGGATTSRHVWPAVLLSSVGVSGLLLLLFVRNHRYFFVDDRISEIVPKGMDIGRLVRRGELPWLSTDIVNGGGYAVEYLMGIFNPVNVALYVVTSYLDDAALASFVYVLAHALLLTASAAWLGRTMGLSTAWSTAFAVSVGFQPYTVLWSATAWSQGLVSFAWLVLAVGASFAFHLRPRRRYGWLLLLGVFGTLTSGWPHAILVLGVFVVVLLVARLWARCALRGTVWLAVWSAAGAVCSLVALYPLMTSFAVASRKSSTANIGNFNVAPLEALLHFADPAYYGFFFNFEGYALQELPHFYVAWFALPVLLLAVRRPFPPAIRPLLVAAVVMLAAVVLLALGPERLSVFRFPTRALQYSGFFLLVVVGLLVAHGRFSFSRRRLKVLLSVVAVLALNGLQKDPFEAGRVLTLGLVVAALCAAVWAAGRPDAVRRLGRRGGDVLKGGVVVVATIALLATLAVMHPEGRGRDHGFPHELATLEPVSLTDYTLFYGSYLPDGTNPDVYSEYRYSTTGLMVGDRQVNGYSSLGNQYLRTFLPFDDQGTLEPGDAELFTGTDPATGEPWLDLLRVDQVVALRGPFDTELRRLLDPSTWRRVPGRFTAAYQRAPFAQPGLVSHTTAGVEVSDGSCPTTARRECVRVDAPDGGTVRFARVWLPGYSASLDGTPLEVRRESEAFVSVSVPEGGSGELELRYDSPRVRRLTALAVAVLVTVAALSWRFHAAHPTGWRARFRRSSARAS
jgi:hypothetical protein